MTEKVLTLVDVTKSFEKGKRNQKILENINLEIYKNDFTVIMGPSGAGKSTLLYVCSGLEKATTGKVIYHDQNLTSIKEKQMAQIRANDFGFIFQQANLVSNLTLEENIYVAGFMKKENEEAAVKKRTDELLTHMNIKDARNRIPSDVSGGEAQRASVARAVINEPHIIFADEPTGALNKKNTLEVLGILGELNNAGQSIVMVTHDIHGAIRGNRILYLEDGQIKGEKKLSKYREEDEKEREADVNKWLEIMEW